MSDTRANDSLRRGIETAKAGNKLLARLHLLQAVELAPSDPNCWLWLAWVAESPASAKHSLERILEEHPDHELAQLGLRWSTAMADFEYQDHTNSPKQTRAVADSVERKRPFPEFTATAVAADQPEEQSESPLYEAEQPSNRFEEQTGFEAAEETSVEKAKVEEEFQEVEPSEALESETSPWFESDASKSSAAQAEEASTEKETLFDEAEDTRVGTGFYFDEPETPWEASSLLEEVAEERPSLEQEPQRTDAPAEESPAVEFTVTDDSGSADVAEAGEESVESNASDETLAESSWWRSSASPSNEAKTENLPPAMIEDGRAGDTWTQETAPEPPQTSPELPRAEAVERQNRFEAAPKRPATPAEQPPFERVIETAAETEGDETDFQADEDDSDHGVSVLVVDDSPTVRKLVTMTMEKAGLTVGSAPDGVVALKCIAELKPRLILLDITMPRLGGYQLCKLIKKHDSTKHIPVIMLSGKDGMFDKVRGKFVGCDDYVTKPFDPDVLVEKVMAQLTEKYGVTATRT